MIPQLEPWAFELIPEFSLRGWRSRWSGKPVIHFLHGNGFCGLAYKPMLELLAEDFDLLVTDLPGHGDSDSGPRFAGWNGSAIYAHSVLHHFSKQLDPATPVYGLGHSYGGVLTGLMASQDHHCYDKTMLLDPVIFSTGMLSVMKVADLFGLLEYSSLAKQARARTHQWDSREEAFDSLNGNGVFKGWSKEAMQAYIDFALYDAVDGVKLKCESKIESKIFGSYPKHLWTRLEQMETPCKILVAERSFPFIARSVERLEAISAYSSDSVPGGHCFMQEDPAQAAKLIKQWFSE